MRTKLISLFILMAASLLAQEDGSARNELAFGLGGIPALSRSDSTRVEAGSGVAFQVNYGRRLVGSRNVALYGEVNFVASPLRDVTTSVSSATLDFASLYITPGVRVKFLPARTGPWSFRLRGRVRRQGVAVLGTSRRGSRLLLRLAELQSGGHFRRPAQRCGHRRCRCAVALRSEP